MSTAEGGVDKQTKLALLEAIESTCGLCNLDKGSNPTLKQILDNPTEVGGIDYNFPISTGPGCRKIRNFIHKLKLKEISSYYMTLRNFQIKPFEIREDHERNMPTTTQSTPSRRRRGRSANSSTKKSSKSKSRKLRRNEVSEDDEGSYEG
jgi:hypothetical protein